MRKYLVAVAALALGGSAYADKSRLEIAKEVRAECEEWKIWGMEPGESPGGMVQTKGSPSTIVSSGA
jgi:hypothetical protein